MSDSAERDVFTRVDRLLAKFESAALVLVMTVMVGLSLLQFVLRKSFDFGFEWADIVARQMVLWLGFLGGALATQRGRHIAIDALARFLPAKPAAWMKLLTSLVAAALSLLMCWTSVAFVLAERADETMLFEDVPVWPFEVVMPLGFLLIAIHFFIGAKHEVDVTRGRRAPRAFEEDTSPGGVHSDKITSVEGST